MPSGLTIKGKQGQPTPKEFPILSAEQMKTLTPEQTKEYQNSLKQYIGYLEPGTSTYAKEQKQSKVDEKEAKLEKMRSSGPLTTPQVIKESPSQLKVSEPVKVLTPEEVSNLTPQKLKEYETMLSSNIKKSIEESIKAQKLQKQISTNEGAIQLFTEANMVGNATKLAINTLSKATGNQSPYMEEEDITVSALAKLGIEASGMVIDY